MPKRAKEIVLPKDLSQAQWADLQRAEAAADLEQITGKAVDPADIAIDEITPKGVRLDFGAVFAKLGLKAKLPN